jgi:hydroxyacylglutathione hydrolase
MIFIKQYYLECLSHASYLVGDTRSGRAVVIDPQRDVQQYLDDAKANGLGIERVIHTHIHADFISGQLELAAVTGASICYGQSKATFGFPVEQLVDQQRLDMGDLSLIVLATPGHTPESICLLAVDLTGNRPDSLFTGDTLFVGDVGRPDLAAGGGSPTLMAQQLHHSIHNQLLTLDDATVVYPAHGAGSACGKSLSSKSSSTIGEQRRTNYALQPMTRDEFVEAVLTGQTAPPRHFANNVAVNLVGASILGDCPVIPRLSDDEFLALTVAGIAVLDIRSASDFAKGHVHRSINIGLEGRVAEFAGQLLEPSSPLVLVCSQDQHIEAAKRLARTGFDQVIGFWEPANDASSIAVSTSLRLAPLEFQSSMTLRGVQIVDVRNSTELAGGIVPGAICIPLTQLRERADELSVHLPTVVYCAGGYRSSIAVSLLRVLGFTVSGDVDGGFQAWASANLTIEAPSWVGSVVNERPTTCSR